MAGISMLAAGCVQHRVIVREQPVDVSPLPQPTAETVVPEAPPLPAAEVISVAPGPEHVWIPGYWAWLEGRWVWMSGHWVLRPHSQAVWVPGCYRMRGGVHIWVGGYWR